MNKLWTPGDLSVIDPSVLWKNCISQKNSWVSWLIQRSVKGSRKWNVLMHYHEQILNQSNPCKICKHWTGLFRRSWGFKILGQLQALQKETLKHSILFLRAKVLDNYFKIVTHCFFIQELDDSNNNFSNKYKCSPYSAATQSQKSQTLFIHILMTTTSKWHLSTVIIVKNMRQTMKWVKLNRLYLLKINGVGGGEG